MGSASEAEIGAAYINGQEAVPIRTLLLELGHPHPATPIQVDNYTAEGFANDTIKQKRSKAIDMRFYWIQDRTSQGQILIYWQPGIANVGDYPYQASFTVPPPVNVTSVPAHNQKLAQCAIAHILRGSASIPAFPQL